MARAKRTQRAEARRRYRGEQSLGAQGDADAIDAPASAAPASRSTSSSQTNAPRQGVGNAFRAAFRPVDIRSDLRALPQLVRHRALWIPVAITLATTVLFVVVRPEGRTDILGVVTVFLYQYFVVTPAIGGVFIAGFLAPKASWLYGILVGLVAAICYSFLVVRGFIGTAPSAETQGLARDVVLASFFLSPLVGAFFASTAAWYRRFLYLSNPNRGRAKASGSSSRPDGRTRSSDQKASARR
ncbi:MAG TPA: hypothetical protein VFN41_00110 [Candidatus Limnocylindrales bacterium]|nr:hypothetical protein [Candidatus Limnocylindrales bacterium]